MKKLLSLTLCVMFVMLAFATSVCAATYNYDSFTAGNGYGTKTKVDDNITNIKGEYNQVSGMVQGAFSKASTAKLADGINEKVHIEINPEELADKELFEVTLSLNDANGDYVSETVVMAQKDNGKGGVVLTAGWAPSFQVIVDEEGVYTYQWEVFRKDNKTFVKFTLLDNGTVVGTTGEIDFDTITAGAGDLIDSVRSLWFCNVQVEDGINVYAELPVTEEPPVEDDEEEPAVDDKKEPAADDKKEPAADDKKEPAADDKKEPAKKDETPKTGSVDTVLFISAIVAVVSVAGIVTVKKYAR